MGRRDVARRWAAGIITALAMTLGTSVAAREPLVINTAAGPAMKTYFEAILDEVSRRTGIATELVTVPAERALLMVGDGTDDGNMVRIAGIVDLYPDLVLVPEPVMDYQFTAFAVGGGALPGGWADLANRDVGYITGWKIVEQHMDIPAMAIPVTEPAQLFRLLDQGRAQIAIYERWEGRALAESLDLPDIRPMAPPLLEQPMYLVLNVRHEALTAPMAEALRAMKADGTYDRISRWLPGAADD